MSRASLQVEAELHELPEHGLDKPVLEIGVLADDLSGALAAAGRLRGQGLRVQLEWDLQREFCLAGGVVVNMGTRDGSGDPGEIAAAWARKLRDADCRRFELRIDSTLRGSPTQELRGIFKGARMTGAVVVAVPAFPEAGRSTVDGRQQISDCGSKLAVPGGNVGSLLFGGRPFEIMDRAGGPLVERIEAAIERGVSRFVVDAESEGDLVWTAAEIARLKPPGREIVTVSPSAWLAHYPFRRPQIRHFAMLVIASPTPSNRRQLNRLQAELGDGVSCAAVRWANHADGAELREALGESAVVVVETLSDEEGGTESAAAAAAAARRCLLALERGPRRCSGIVVSGGKAAHELLGTLEVAALIPRDERQPLCGRTTIAGGPFGGMEVIAKGGMVGSDDALVDLSGALLEGES